MVRERQALEVFILAYGLEDTCRGGFRFQYVEDFGVHAVEHTGVDEIRSYAGCFDLAAGLFQFNPERFGPSCNRPFAGAIDRKPWHSQHSCR